MALIAIAAPSGFGQIPATVFELKIVPMVTVVLLSLQMKKMRKSKKLSEQRFAAFWSNLTVK